MMEDTISVVWGWAGSWCTPSVLFLLLNLTILTIALTSFKSHTSTAAPPSPSILHRLKSLSPYNPTPTFRFDPSSHHPPTSPETSDPESEVDEPEPQPQPVPHRQKEDPTLDEVFGMIQTRRRPAVTRVKSDTIPASGEAVVPVRRRMRKSASAKSEFAHFPAAPEQDVEPPPPRPATVREGVAAPKEEEEEVDARCDDFINRFRQQLKLQRLDSIMRYKDMLKRGNNNTK